MGKINNTTAYETATPTADTIVIGSVQGDGATKNYAVSALATYMSGNITSFTSLSLSGSLTVSGTTSLTGLKVTSLPQFTGLSVFANNAAAVAGGLAVNDVYKTATGELRIVV